MLILLLITSSLLFVGGSIALQYYAQPSGETYHLLLAALSLITAYMAFFQVLRSAENLGWAYMASILSSLIIKTFLSAALFKAPLAMPQFIGLGLAMAALVMFSIQPK